MSRADGTLLPIPEFSRLRMLGEALAVSAILYPMLFTFNYVSTLLGMRHPVINPQAVTFVAVICLGMLRLSNTPFRDVGIKLPSNLRRMLFWVLLGTVLIMSVDPLMKGIIFPALGIPYIERSGAWVALMEGKTSLYVPYMIFIVFLSAGIGEEIISRGFLLNRIEKAFDGFSHATLIALIGQAALFGTFHFKGGPQSMFTTALSGIILGIVYLKCDRNLFASILTHILVNSIYITSYYNGHQLIL